MSHTFLDNKYVSGFFTLVIILYSTMLHPKLPQPVVNLFKNNIFKIAVLLLVLIKGHTDPVLALVIAIAFVLTLDFIYTKESFEAFSNIEHMKNPDASVQAVIKAENEQVWDRKSDTVCKVAYDRCVKGSNTEPSYGATFGSIDTRKSLYGASETTIGDNTTIIGSENCVENFSCDKPFGCD